RVPAGPLDDGAAGLQHPLPLGVLDHREPDPVLHRATRVEELDLGEDGAREAGAEPPEPDERRLADGVEDGVLPHGGGKRESVRRSYARRPPPRTHLLRLRGVCTGTPGSFSCETTTLQA